MVGKVRKKNDDEKRKKEMQEDLNVNPKRESEKENCEDSITIL